MKKLHKALLAGGVTLAVLVPAASAFAAGYGPGNGAGGGERGDGVCTGDQSRDQVQARDGTGWRHTLSDGTTVEVPAAPGYQHRDGLMDGTGPQADRPLDGSGSQWRAGQ